MKTTVAASLLAFFGLKGALACNKLGCEMLAEELDIDFSTAASVDGAPSGCVKFKNNNVIWVESCNSEEDCDPSTCNKCKLVTQQCAGKTYTFNAGATCLKGYYPIATRWEDCRDAAIALGLPNRVIKDVDLDFPWGSTKPKGCFRDGANSKIYFNRGEGGGFSEGDRILCQNFDAGSTVVTPNPTPKPTPAPTPTPLLGLNGKCWDPSKTMEERDALCAGDLVCARSGFDGRSFGGCTTTSDGNYVAGPPYKHHCCSMPESSPEPTPAPTPTLLGRNGKCWDHSKTMEERDALCAGDLVCARSGFDGRNFGGCTTDSDGNYVAGPPYRHHCCSDPAYTYTLRGSTGEELVRINDNDSTVLLSKEEKLFAVQSVVLVEFTNDAHTSSGDRNVYFKSDIAHTIVPSSGTVLKSWNGNWNCDTFGESTSCDLVRRGTFAWKGTYKITFYEDASSTRRMEQSKTNNVVRRLLGYEDAPFRL